MKRTKSGWIGGLVGATALITGCSTLLGFEELSGIDEDASTPSQDGAIQTETGSDSGPGGDGGEAATQDQAAEDAPVQDYDAHPCVDVLKDPYNCGVCGHDCLGGECKGGLCQPVLLLDGLAEPTELVVFGDSILVAESQGESIYRVPKDGTKATVFKNTPYPCSMFLDSSHLYWATCYDESGAINRCKLPDCTGQESLEPANYSPGLIKTDERLFWTESNYGRFMTKGLSADAGAPVNLAPPEMALAPHRLVRGGDYVYFTSIEYADRGLYRVKADGSPGLETVYSGPAAFGVAISAGWVVWSVSGYGDGQIRRFPVNGDVSKDIKEVIADQQMDPFHVTADDQTVYWVTTGGDTSEAIGQVISCPMSDCKASQRIHSEQESQPWRIAVDDRAIYWLNRGVAGSTTDNGSLRMIAK